MAVIISLKIKVTLPTLFVKTSKALQKLFIWMIYSVFETCTKSNSS